MSSYYAKIDNKFDELLSKIQNNKLVFEKQDLIDLKTFILIAYKTDNAEDISSIKASFKKLQFKITQNTNCVEFVNN